MEQSIQMKRFHVGLFVFEISVVLTFDFVHQFIQCENSLEVTKVHFMSCFIARSITNQPLGV